MENRLMIALMAIGLVVVNPFIAGADSSEPDTEQGQTDGSDDDELDEGEGEAD